MKKFKVGDIVKVGQNLEKSFELCGFAKEMEAMKGHAYEIEEDDELSQSIILDYYYFHEDDLELAAKCENAFVEAMLAGEKIRGVNDGVAVDLTFAGYAILPANDEYLYIVDKDGVGKLYSHYPARFSPIGPFSSAPQFEVQPPTIKKHVVAYTAYDAVLDEDCWFIKKMTDEELGKRKHEFDEYRILETLEESC